MAVELDMTDERATIVWCRGARAIKGFRKAVDDHHPLRMARYGAYMEAMLSEIAEAAPQELAPTGNETDKP